MRKLTTFLIAGAITAWMAYLSWPVSADAPPIRGKSLETPHVSDAYEPKSWEPSA